jgi:hypothetical protein
MPGDRHRDPGGLKELWADNVFLFPGMENKVVVEVQTTRPKHDRMLAWPCYVTRARAYEVFAALHGNTIPELTSRWLGPHGQNRGHD